MKGKIRRIDFSAAEWLEGTAELDNATRGLYITACALMYARGGPITIDLLKSACRDHGHALRRQFEALTGLGKLTVNDGQISNKRCANELQKALKRIANVPQNRPELQENNDLPPPSAFGDGRDNHQPPTINHQEDGEPKESLPENPESSKTAQAPFSAYAFSGRIIRLTEKDYATWRRTYHGVPDLQAELVTLDAYYDTTLIGDDRKRWFIRCSAALDKKHQEAMREKQQPQVDIAKRYRNEGMFG